ncbi:hypothetical protein DUNSADRAFT_15049 [Dunaliella salina]|uniref:RING-type domain-containing protein n=1 Tax=Dunaliella salina TaxID=3046 RepID=A0ABQ7G648_DUNSA|nr:hypothetical protein DUNSADRAFT_15049 [Dunaliella salina]|eukprot:KAF5830088.1 hypothetical protein DUNSADRAFT_15049 [Dunaliella salina]
MFWFYFGGVCVLAYMIYVQFEMERQKNASLVSDLLMQIDQQAPNQRCEHLRRQVEELQEQQQCSICSSKPKEVAFLCGHRVCRNCNSNLSLCPFCKKRITHRIKLYDA